jgi:uncharacterized membrane protein
MNNEELNRTFMQIFSSNMVIVKKPKSAETAESNTDTIFRDSPQRSFIKALTYRVMASGVMFIVFFIIFRSATKRSLNESLGDATLISIIDFVVKLAIYYFHERIWSGIKWGKYWKRNYWARKAWKKAYRKAHKNNNPMG